MTPLKLAISTNPGFNILAEDALYAGEGRLRHPPVTEPVRRRFGLGKPINTYGMPCLHAKPIIPTKDKEGIEALSYKDIIDAQSSIFWKQAITEAIQDSNLKALAGVAEDLGELKSYYENGELSLTLKGRTLKGCKMPIKLPLSPKLF